MIEAVCNRCGETFIPASEDPEDLIHGVTENGDECGGTGSVTGEWVWTPPPPTYGCVWADDCDYETPDWGALMDHSWTHRDATD